MAVWWRIVVVAMVVAAAGGCGERQADGGGAASSDVVRLVSVSSDSGESETVEVIAEPGGRYRITVVSGPSSGVVQVWDGKALLMHLPDESPQYQRYEDPDRNEIPVATWFYRPDSDVFRKFCPGAKKLGTKTLFDRTAVRYHCDETVPSETEPTEPMAAREIALDEKTGLLMADGRVSPTEVTFGAETTPDTFSTEVPAGAETVPSEPAEGEEPAMYPAELPAVGGGSINTASYSGKPYVVVAGPADVFPAPVGVDIKGATAASFASNPTGVTIALVTADNRFAHVAPAGDVSDADLRQWIAELS